MYSLILLAGMAGGDAPAFFAPSGCRGHLALVSELRTVTVHRLARVHSAPKTGCAGSQAAPASFPLPMPGPGPTTTPAAPVAPKKEPAASASVSAPVPVSAVLRGRVRAVVGVCANGLCGR